MFDDIALFIKLAEIANYTKTAAILNTTQATLSRRIQNLESLLGVYLVRRNCRVFELTEQGVVVFQHMRDSIHGLQLGLSNFVENKHLIQGTLKVALPAALAYTLISSKISDFASKYPYVKLLISYSAAPIDMMRDDFNLAVSTTLPLSQSSKVRVLKKFNFKLYASGQYIQRYGVPTSLSEINMHKTLGLISLDGSLCISYVVNNLQTGTESVFNQDAQVYINNILHGIQIAKSGEFIIGAWDELVQNELANQELFPVLAELSFGELPCYLIRHGHGSTKLENLFADFILGCFKV